MRYRFIAAHAALLAFAVLLAPAARAEDAPKDVKGIYLVSDYPAVTLRPGETSTINLRLQNYDMAPERMALSVSGVPSGWTATLLGGGAFGPFRVLAAALYRRTFRAALAK